MAFDGTNHLLIWEDDGLGTLNGSTGWQLYGQFISQGGSLIGGKLPLSTEAGNQLGGAGYAHGQHFVMVNSGVTMGSGGITQVDAATGIFVAPLPALQVLTAGSGFGVQSNRFGFNMTGASGQLVVVEASSSLSNSSWLPVQTNTLVNGSSYFGDSEWTHYTNRYYRLRPL